MLHHTRAIEEFLLTTYLNRNWPMTHKNTRTPRPGDGSDLIPDDFDERFQRAFGLLAFSVNRHIIDHMRRIGVELSMDAESVQIWGTLAHMNVLPRLPLGADPMSLLDEMGRKKDLQLEPIRLAELTQITGLPRETVRRKLELLCQQGKVERTDEGKWVYVDTGIDENTYEFTRKTVFQFLKTAQSLKAILDSVNLE